MMHRIEHLHLRRLERILRREYDLNEKRSAIERLQDWQNTALDDDTSLGMNRLDEICSVEASWYRTIAERLQWIDIEDEAIIDA